MTEHYRTRIAAERQRQIDVEGYTAEHDKGHTADLLLAARAYVQAADLVDDLGHKTLALGAPVDFPWAAEFWKPGTPERMREKAGALALAAIDAMAGGPDVVTTEGEVDALPSGTVLRDSADEVYECGWEDEGRAHWWNAGGIGDYPSHVIALPAVVLYRGSAS